MGITLVYTLCQHLNGIKMTKINCSHVEQIAYTSEEEVESYCAIQEYI